MLGNTIGLNVFNRKSEKTAEVSPENMIDNKLKNLNIELEDLEKEIPDFNFLSPGQKVLALENLEQSILGEIKEDALEGYQKRFSKMTGKEEGVSRFNLHNAGVLGQNLWLGITKQYQLAKIEKAKSEELLTGGLEIHKEVLTKLTEGLKNYGPDAELNKEGELQINYLKKIEGLSAEEEKEIDDFNASATALSKIPDEWRYDTAKEADRKKYNQALWSHYNKKESALNILSSKKGEGSACLEMNKIDSQIRLNQFLNSNPEVEAQLLKIKDQSLVRKVLSGVIAERGIYMGAGFASRTLATLGLGALGSVAVFGGVVAGAGAIGYFKSKGRAQETIRQKDIMGRRGQKDEGELSKIFALGGGKKRGNVDEKNEISVGLGDKINSIIIRLENEDNHDKKVELANRLKTRLEYTKKYLDNGAVDFGSKEEHLNNQYDLMTNMAQAETYLYYANWNDDQRQEVEKRIEKSIYDKLDEHDQKIEQKRKEYVVKKARQGMMISMGFAAAGRIFNELIHSHGDVQEHLNSEKKLNISDNDIIAKEPIKGDNTVIAEQPGKIIKEITKESASTSPNNQELVNYLTNSSALKSNLDLKTSLLNQKITINILEKGQSIGTYANVTNNTPINFVQPDGSVEVHNAGEIYVHPGDRVIQAENGQIYVIKDSGIKGLEVKESFVEKNSNIQTDDIKKMETIKVDHVDEPSYIATHKITEDITTDSETPSYVEDHKAEINNNAVDKTEKPSYVEDVKKETAINTETNKGGAIKKFKEFFGGKKMVESSIIKTEVPASFAKGDVINEDLVSQWNELSDADQAVYKNFAENSSLYNTNPELAVTKFLGQTPADIVHEPGSTEVVATLDNGHTVIFDTEEDQIIIKVDDGGYDIVNPEKIIATKKLIQSDYSIPEDVSDTPVENDANIEDVSDTPKTNTANNEVLADNNELIVADAKLWATRPDVKVLEFNHEDFTPTKEAQIQEFYNNRVELLNEIKKQYSAMKLEYSDNPKFYRFQDIVKTFYAVENEKVKNIIEGAGESDKFIFPIDEDLKTIQNPKKEVSEYLQRIAAQTLFKKE